jgi:multicomponent K+:H+ antiporter subunit E
MRRLFPHPLLWLSLLALWLLLAGSLAPGQILLGAAMAAIGSWAVAALEPPRPRLRRPGSILRLTARVLFDVIQSNLAVLGLLLSRREPQSAFVAVPLEVREPNALAVLACIVTATPGSAWIEHVSETGVVTIHVLDTPDPDAWGRTLKRNYETLLLETFQ